MQVCFFWNDRLYEGVDVSAPEQGNPGIGGTDYLMVSLPYELHKMGVCESILVHFNSSNRVPAFIPSTTIGVDVDLSRAMQLQGWSPDLFVARASDARKLAEITPPGTKIIAWAHNHLRRRDLEWLSQCDKISAVVHVGEEQMLLAQLSSCYEKSRFIHNGFYSSGLRDSMRAGQPRAVYLGALIPEKGFHRLAKLWPKILRLSPNAWLDVIGGADVYGGSRPLGSLGVADPSYEDLLLNNLGTLNPESVHVKFHGRLGAAKDELLSRAWVGLPNPTGFTETFCLSAVEMADAGCAIVAPRRWGFLDTVIHAETGILCRSDDEYVHAVSSLLNNLSMTSELGLNGHRNANHKFSYTKICAEWGRLFTDINKGHRVNSTNGKLPVGEYPHSFLYRLSKKFKVPQLAVDVIDSLYGYRLKR